MLKYPFFIALMTVSLHCSAQKMKEYNSNEFKYRVFYTERGGTCVIDSIVATRQKGDQRLPKIIPPKNKSYCGVKYDPLIVEDYNFDKHDDISIVKLTSPTAATTYYYWLYNVLASGFVLNSTLENIPSPKVDKKNQYITSEWKSTESLFGTSIYTWEDTGLTKTGEIEQEYISDVDGVPSYIEVTTKKLVKDKFKVISKKKKRIDEGP